MSDLRQPRVFSRRQTIAGISLAGAAFVQAAASAQEPAVPATGRLLRHLSTAVMSADKTLQAGDWVETVGFHTPGDGGAARYQVAPAAEDRVANGADLIAIGEALVAVLSEAERVNYAIFGTRSDGASDDGVAIKLAHAYANRHGLPVINLSGEYWLRETNGIPIRTPVQWGQSIFHIDERFNTRGAAKFYVQADEPAKNLTDDEAIRTALLEKLTPGVQIIPELAAYSNHLFIVQDNEDRIGIRAGYEGNQGWAREELFYVEEEGRILGDIAWDFTGFTSIRALPCPRNYLVIEGGGLLYSGDTPENSQPGYHQVGITIQRSRTILRDQWAGLEPGRTDVSLEPRSGIYTLSQVYDVTLENIRAMPWIHRREPPAQTVKHGTYGIGGSRWLDCTFRNLTAEGGWASWGVFGTNLNKNFRLERCHLNRVDVHFHCWNLAIRDCTIGFKGITVTGGGELTVENTTRDGDTFIAFRRDYGAKWDGPIRLRGCTLRPSGSGPLAVLSLNPADFDYQYPIGLGTSIEINDLRLDYRAAPNSTAPCWLLAIPSFSVTRAAERLFFPQRLLFRDVYVEGREQGVRLLRVPNPQHYRLGRPGGNDGTGLQTNVLLTCERVQLEQFNPAEPGDPNAAHLLLGGEPAEYADAYALYPRLVFTDCEGLSLHLAHCAAEVACLRGSLNTITARAVQGGLSLDQCRLRPTAEAATAPFYVLESSRGTTFTNCTLHAPRVAGAPAPERLAELGFLELNGALHHGHLNTTFGPEVLAWLREEGIELSPAFLAQLRARHPLEG